MGILVTAVDDRRQLRRWVELPDQLYRNVPNFVPQLQREQLTFFDARRNPSFDTAAVRLFLAERDGQAVGRLCAIVNALETEKLGRKRGRFGWFESVDDPAVANALLDAARDWLRGEGCVEMTGPHGFTDLDMEGLLIDGFDELPTISGSYNFPYYADFMEAWGLTKDVDYLEFRAEIPDRLPLFEKLRKRYRDIEYDVITCATRKELKSHLPAIWALLEETFEPLYGVVPLTAAQREFYTDAYFDFLDPDFVILVFNRDGGLVGFMLAMPSLSRAFQRARGRLLPFGFLHILRAFRKPETVDFLLAGAKPSEPSSILVAIGLIAMFDKLRERGVRFIETNHELEGNTTVNQLWTKLKLVSTRRSRIYRLDLSR